MANQHPYWWVAFLREVPESVDEGILLAKGFDSEIPSDSLAYALLFRTVAPSKLEARDFIVEAVQTLAVPSECPSEEIALEPACVRRSERIIVAGLNVGDVAMHQSFIGFNRGDADAKREAVSIIRSTIAKRRWEFWK